MNAQSDYEPVDHRSLALAGTVLAADLVHDSAHGRPLNEPAVTALRRAILTHNVDSVTDVFGDPGDFRGGVDSAIAALSGRPKHPDVLRYALAQIELARLLRKSPAVISRLRSGLEQLSADPDDAAFARVYQSSISTLGKRIQVTGDPERLRRPDTADTIRALLLSGIRFAWLWQQLGGRRWHLVLKRGETLRQLESLNAVLRTNLH